MSAYLDKMAEAAKRVREEEKESTPPDWVARRDWWTGQVVTLFDRLEEWADPILKLNIIDGLSRGGAQIDEEYLGVYMVQTLEIKLGERKLSFKPIGSVVVGSVGRIDVKGPGGLCRLILNAPLGANPASYMENAVWSISNASQPFSMHELNAESFIALVAVGLGLTTE